MKHGIFLVMVVGFFSAIGCGGNQNGLDSSSVSSVEPTAKPLVNCDAGEEVQVAIRDLSNGKLRADVTVQSAGDSYPTYRYQVKVLSTANGITTFSGKEFNLKIERNTNPAAGHLSVSDLGIDRSVKCVGQYLHINI